MRHAVFVSALSISLATISAAQSAEITELWRTNGFDLPESVSWDQDAQAFFVSNIGGDPMSKDGNGTISKVNPDGSMAEAAWASGMDAPKGIDIAGGTLYVSDVDHVVAFDVATGNRLADYPVPGAAFLNDVYAAPDGRVFVSDTFGNAIFVIESGNVSLVARDPLLAGANGVTMIGNDLIIADLGDASNGFDKIVPGTVVKIDLATNAVSYFGSPDSLGVLDGIEPDGQSVLVTDNGGGRLLIMAPGGAGEEIGKLEPGAADLEYVPAEQLIVVPQTQTNTIVAYRLTP
ncbi:MAG: gluconolaconase [Hyphomicrobiaceae bacterium]|nr:gluconolaconase [Hyphomicrobiaceae bacterium]